MKYVIAVLLVLTAATAWGSSYKRLQAVGNQILYVYHPVYYNYPNVIVMIKNENEITKDTKYGAFVAYCDEWKVSALASVPHNNGTADYDAIKSMETKKVDIVKGTKGALLFYDFCSELHRRTPWQKQ